MVRVRRHARGAAPACRACCGCCTRGRCELPLRACSIELRARVQSVAVDSQSGRGWLRCARDLGRGLFLVHSVVPLDANASNLRRASPLLRHPPAESAMPWNQTCPELGEMATVTI